MSKKVDYSALRGLNYTQPDCGMDLKFWNNY